MAHDQRVWAFEVPIAANARPQRVRRRGWSVALRRRHRTMNPDVAMGQVGLPDRLEDDPGRSRRLSGSSQDGRAELEPGECHSSSMMSERTVAWRRVATDFAACAAALSVMTMSQ